ncbi:MAG: 2-phospho-L-lactate transferase CofD family protein, partial [Thermoleophilaceae bacterium]
PRVRVRGRWLAFQEFMIVERAEGPVEAVELGVDAAEPTPEVLAALRDADAIVIGPSNPIASIGPILTLPGMRAALAEAAAPVVALSPFVGGKVLKGPTRLFCDHAGIDPSAAGIADAYAGILDGLVADEPVDGLPALETATLMDTPASRRALARSTLDFAATLAARDAPR